MQGVDYAYTLQGWLKGMNADSLSGINDMGRDGDTTSISKFIQPKDVVGYSISYFNGDYAPIGTSLFNKDLRSAGSAYLSASPGLFNGNIRAITVHNISLGDGKPIGYAYSYDQLHRLAAMDAWTAPTGANKSVWDAAAAAADFQERVSYDANGNILKYRRNAAAGVLMDSLNYKYNAGTNQLQYVSDNVAAGAFPNDIDNQPVNNYVYDGAGNMIQDLSQGETVKWSPYGKVTDVAKTVPTTTKLFFGYDPMQHRVLKGVVSGTDTLRTYYFHDAQGNTMGVYTRHNDSVFWREQYIYGSSRLGLYRADTLINKGLQSITKLYEGKRQYEISNHLGNVMAVVNDRRTDSLVGTVKRFGAVVVSASDYYPFGLTIDSRSYSSSTYRYGFNGKENDKEWGKQDYGERGYDLLACRFFSVDPLAWKYPWYSPYQFAGNMPIWAVDLDGLEPAGTNGANTEARDNTRPTEYANRENLIKYGGVLIREVVVKASRIDKGTPDTWKKENMVFANGGSISYTVNGVKVEQINEITGSKYYAVYTGGNILFRDEAQKHDEYLKLLVQTHEYIAIMNISLLQVALTLNPEGVGTNSAEVVDEIVPQQSTNPIITQSGRPGRLGNLATRNQVDEIATELEKRGYTVEKGGQRDVEEYLKPIGGGRKGGSYTDITAYHPKYGKLRINTVDVKRDGITPTLRESRNASRIRKQIGPREHLLLIPKQ